MLHPIRFARRRPKVAVLAVVVLALVFAGVGYAIWSMSQQTTALEGSTGNTITLGIVSPSAADLSAAQQCFPGSSCPLLGKVSNPSGTPVTLTSYQPSQAAGFTDAGLACSQLSGPAEGSASVPISPGIVVPAGASNLLVSIPNAFSLPSNAATNCENITIVETAGHVTLTFTAGS
jgi:hypothetical protein